MRPARPTSRRRTCTWAAAAGIALLAGALSACGDDGSPGSSDAAPSAAVGDELATAMKPLDAYPVPTEK
ncbi:hypothetical protein ACWC3X_45155, partial [Streptomyces populi]